jgi:hypothetical protein
LSNPLIILLGTRSKAQGLRHTLSATQMFCVRQVLLLSVNSSPKYVQFAAATDIGVALRLLSELSAALVSKTEFLNSVLILSL